MSDEEFVFDGDDDGVTATPENQTVLDRLRAEVQKQITKPSIEIEVPDREGVSVVYSPNITNAMVTEWQNRAGIKSKNGMDQTKFACYIVGNTCEGIYFNGEEVTDDEGQSLNFASPTIMEMTDTDRPLPDAIVAFFGLDSHVVSTALAILEKSGLGEEVEPQDPTKGLQKSSAQDPRIQSAARMGEVWGQDPIALLDCDEDIWMIRHGAALVIANDREKERQEMEKRSGG